MNERIVALDIGDVRIGVAVSDPTRTIAVPVEVITRVGWGPDVRRIREICDRYETHLIVSGLPLNMDGTEGFQAKKVRDFCRQLEHTGLRITFQDERLTTVTAEDALLKGNISRSGRKQKIDKVAAAIILEQWLKEKKEEGDTNMADDIVNRTPEGEENDELVELIDENGESTLFEHLATLEYEGESYLALCDPEADEDSLEVFILRIDHDENGSDVYNVPDDDVADAVFAKLVQLTEDLDQE